MTGPVSVPNTGGWQTWTTVRKTGVNLNAGSQVWRFVADSAGGTGAFANLNYIRIAAPASGGPAPFGGSPTALPGTIQVENFDEGTAGVAYADSTAGNSGATYRSTDVDIEKTSDTGGGYDIGWVAAGEWLRYTVSIATAGAYDIDIRVACSHAGGTFHIEVDGTDVTGPILVPNTGGSQAWRTLRVPNVTLSAGPQVWRLVMDTNGSTGGVGNFNWLQATLR